MELAFQFVTGRGGRADLMLLDTATGDRRRLVARVTWAGPRWSADGRRVGFEQRSRGGGFRWREVDVGTGAVEDLVDVGGPDGSALPGFSDAAVRSPHGDWIAYRHRSSILGLGRPDGSAAFAVGLPFAYVAAGAYWSPDGAMLATYLTAGSDTGAYVIDLRTGIPRRVSPVGGTSNYFVSGWTPDGAWVVATRNRWPEPRTYDHELNDLCLLAADGTGPRPLTDDGRSRHGAVRPTGAAPVNQEHELTLGWAQPLRRADAPAPAGLALTARIRLDLDTGPPFAILVTVRTGGPEYPIIDGCADIPDGFARLDGFLRDHDYRPAEDFTVILPRYATDGPDQDGTVLQIAHLVRAETERRHWRFARDAPRF